MARARAMPPGEWPHRFRQAALVAAERRRPPALVPFRSGARGWPRPPGAAPLVCDEDVALVQTIPGAVDRARAHGEAVAAGRVRFFGFPEVALPPEPDWHLDAVAGVRWPERHWSLVNHREGPSDPKWLWELGRHQHLVHLALAHRLTGQRRFAAVACGHLSSFVRQSPPSMGIHWRTGLEVAIRLISWAWVVELLRGAPELTPALQREMVPAIGAHLAHLERYPSRYSSDNNHRIGEAAGLAVGGFAFPEVAGAAAHAETGLAELVAALDRQVLPDGVDAEQAIGYHGFVLDLGLAVTACLRRLGREVPQGLARPLAAVAAFLGTIASDAGTVPAIGDEDEGLGIDLMPGSGAADRLHSRLRTAAVLLDAELPRLEPGLDEQTAWLCGPLASALPEATRRRPGSAVFPHGGYAVLRRRSGEGGEVRAVLDAGPFGLAPLYAHAHADLLAVCLAVDGEEVVVDPGTFTYFGERRWRDYGRSTGAHSTIRIDGRDQALPAGRFLWRSAPPASLGAVELGENGQALSASGHHEAYRPVRHDRRLTLDEKAVVVVDRLSGPGEHEIELRWHLAPGETREVDEGVLWRGRRASLAVAVCGLGPPRVVVGDEATPLGVVSFGLERREPAPALVARARLRLPARVVTTLAPGEAIVPPHAL